MNLQLSDEQAAALERELTAIINGDRYFLSPRIQMLREIRNMIRPEPKREPLPEPKLGERSSPDSAISSPKHYEPAARRTIPQTRLVKSEPGPPLRRHFATPKEAKCR
jgi:hypothetical protein